MSRDRIDPESRRGLDALLEIVPGGFNAIPDIADRRAALKRVLDETTAALPPNERVATDDRVIDGPKGASDVSVRVFRPAGAAGVLPGIYYIHGGGMSMGSIDGEAPLSAMLCETINAVIVSVEYRLAPEHPYPAAVEDCYAGLVWMAENAPQLGFDRERLAIYGGSAGGGLAIATALTTGDRGGPAPCFIMALYPMIDDRNETPSSHEITNIGIWDRDANREAWEWYLGGKRADGYAAPARVENLNGLPPTFIDVGAVDLFRDEDIAFATRLLQAGVPTELHVCPGSYHGSEVFAPDATLSKTIWARRIEALRRALHPRSA
jgi:acetyl esterase/lipase